MIIDIPTGRNQCFSEWNPGKARAYVLTSLKQRAFPCIRDFRYKTSVFSLTVWQHQQPQGRVEVHNFRDCICEEAGCDADPWVPLDESERRRGLVRMGFQNEQRLQIRIPSHSRIVGYNHQEILGPMGRMLVLINPILNRARRFRGTQ